MAGDFTQTSSEPLPIDDEVLLQRRGDPAEALALRDLLPVVRRVRRPRSRCWTRGSRWPAGPTGRPRTTAAAAGLLGSLREPAVARPRNRRTVLAAGSARTGRCVTKRGSRRARRLALRRRPPRTGSGCAPRTLNCFLACAYVMPGVVVLLRQVQAGDPGQALDELRPDDVLTPGRDPVARRRGRGSRRTGRTHPGCSDSVWEPLVIVARTCGEWVNRLRNSGKWPPVCSSCQAPAR